MKLLSILLGLAGLAAASPMGLAERQRKQIKPYYGHGAPG